MARAKRARGARPIVSVGAAVFLEATGTALAAREAAAITQTKGDPMLYESSQIEDVKLRAKLSAQVLAILRRGYNITVRGSLPGRSTVYVDPGQAGGYLLWSIADNGGEFNVEKVNHLESMRSIPYVDRFGIVDAGTVAYRIAMVLRDQEIDWDFRCPDLIQDFADPDPSNDVA